MSVGTADRLLHQLKSRGPLAAATLAGACAITPMGAHKQLQALQGQGLVTAHDEIDGPGRPKRLWTLTRAGHGRFPDRHADLAVELIRQAAVVLGPDAVDQLILARESEQQAAYDAALSGLRTLGARVRCLAQLRTRDGYLARAEKDGAGWLLIEDHCAICAAATSCQGLCRSELRIFARCLGDGVRVERVEHVLSGGRRCAYRVSRG